MMIDAHWRKVQRRFMYRQSLIADFLNSQKMDEAFENREFNFYLLDPVARKSRNQEDFKKYTSLSQILKFPTVSLIYICLAFLSITIALLVYIAPPNIRDANLSSTIPGQTIDIDQKQNYAHL